MDIQMHATTGDNHTAEVIVDGNSKIKLSSAAPNSVESHHPLTAEDIPDIDNIGGKSYEDINGVPITPKMAAEVRSAEDRAGHDTGKGSAAARVQSAAAYNVQNHVVPPVGTAQKLTTKV